MKGKGIARNWGMACAAVVILLLPIEGQASNLSNAQKLYKAGKYEQALKSARAAVEDDASNVKAHRALIRCYNKLDRLTGALTNYTKLALQQTDNAVYQFSTAYVYDLKGNTQRAIAGYKKAISLNPRLLLANYNLAWIYDDQGELSKAVELYQKEIKNNPSYKDAYYNLGRVYIRMKRYDKAVAVATSLLKVSPNNLSGYNLLGEAYNGQGDEDKALEAWRKTVAIDPKDVQAGKYNVRGLVFVAKGFHNSGMREFRKGIAKQSANSRLHRNLALAYMRKVQAKTFGNKSDKWYKEALKEFQKAIKINPKYGEAYVGLGDAYFALGMNDSGIAQYIKFVELNPRKVEGLNRLGNAYKLLGRYKDAVEQFNKVLAIEPRNAEAYRNLGYTYYYQGQQDAALAQWEISLKLKPNQPLLRDTIRTAFSKHKR